MSSFFGTPFEYNDNWEGGQREKTKYGGVHTFCGFVHTFMIY